MASENTISQPRIDQRFVNAEGQLTQYGYSLLVQIVNRVGGPIGEVLNGRELSAAIAELQIQPQPIDQTLSIEALRNELGSMPRYEPYVAPSEIADATSFSLMAELDALRKRVEALEIGYQV